MSRVRSKNTQPEMLVRRSLWASGLRYRLHAGEVPGRPDIVFRKARVAVFVHGCFWHRHDCKAGSRSPKSNEAFWAPKFEANQARDKKVAAELERTGWRQFVVWECEARSPERLSARTAELGQLISQSTQAR